LIAHRDKKLGGGLRSLRTTLEDRGVTDLAWHEVARSKDAPRQVRKLVDAGVDRILVWGGDGTVRRCIHTIVRKELDASIAILPAGTANLLAKNLGIPIDLDGALDVAINGTPRPIDVGVMNGEHFAVMGGTGFDALMIKDADSGRLKERFGRAGYVQATATSTKIKPRSVEIKVDGEPWFSGDATCVLVANVGTILGGIRAFPDASPTSGRLEVGVIQARSRPGWIRLMARAVAGKVESSPIVTVTSGTHMTVRVEKRWPWEVDGGDQPPAKKFDIDCLPAAVNICRPLGAS
jgi:YegS/Rv2252/BmrU family lipid kinase